MEKYTKNTTAKNTKNTIAKNTTPEKPARVSVWSDVTGRARVFVDMVEGRSKTFPVYSVTVSRKNGDGSYSNVYIKARFAKTCDPNIDADMYFDIDIKSGFLTVDCYTKADGTEGKSLLLMITDFEMID